MKSQRLISLFYLLSFLMIAASCTTINTGDKSTILSFDNTQTISSTLRPTSSILPSPSLTKDKNNIELYSSPQQHMVNIGVSRTISGMKRQYYVPNEGTQSEIIRLLNNVDINKTKIMDIKDPLGFSVVYDGLEWELVSDGTLYTYDKGPKNRLNGYTDLCNYIILLVKNNLGITVLNQAEIKDIIKAELSFWQQGDKETAKQVITDPVKLKHLEDRLSNATVMLGGTGCPFEQALLTMERKDGELIQVRLASDSCQVYFHDGVFFDYDLNNNHINPEDSNETNEDVLDLFDEIPWMGNLIN